MTMKKIYNILDLVILIFLIGWSSYSLNLAFGDKITLEEFRWRRDVYDDVMCCWVMKLIYEKYFTDNLES